MTRILRATLARPVTAFAVSQSVTNTAGLVRAADARAVRNCRLFPSIRGLSIAIVRTPKGPIRDLLPTALRSRPGGPIARESPNMLSKTNTIEAIMDLNPSASPGFLAEFAQDELAKYLFRLADVTPMSSARNMADSPTPHEPWRNDRNIDSAFA